MNPHDFLPSTLILAVFLLLHPSWARGQETAVMRHFPAGKLDSLRAMEPYQYGKEPIPESSSRLRTGKSAALPESPPFRWSIRATMFLCLGILLVIILFSVFRQFTRPTAKSLAGTQATEAVTWEALTKSDFSQLITQAEQEQDWRMALRYTYLRELQLLQHGKHIDWHPYKTDGHYLREIKSPARRESFSTLSGAYAFVWYGGHSFSENQYRSIKATHRPPAAG